MSGNKLKITEANVQGSPDLVVESVSPGTSRHDLLAKRELYERFQIPDYCSVNPKAKTVDVLSLGEGRYRRAASHRGGQHMKSVLLTGLVIDLTSIWPAV